MLRDVQGGTHGQEEDTDDEQPSTSSSGTHQPQLASRSVDSTTVPHGKNSSYLERYLAPLPVS